MDNEESRNTAIIMNGTEITVSGKELTYNQLVNLGLENPPTGDSICITITYRRGRGNKPEGTLAEGENVKIKEGMIFNVTATDKS